MYPASFDYHTPGSVPEAMVQKPRTQVWPSGQSPDGEHGAPEGGAAE